MQTKLGELDLLNVLDRAIHVLLQFQEFANSFVSLPLLTSNHIDWASWNKGIFTFKCKALFKFHFRFKMVGGRFIKMNMTTFSSRPG